MWNAMGQCYQKMQKHNEAQKCYERAENGKDKEGILLYYIIEKQNNCIRNCITPTREIVRPDGL
jgi:hypothetical protein